MTEDIELISRFVLEAIEGKYTGLDEDAIRREITIALSRFSNADEIGEIFDGLHAVEVPEDDINNQVATLVAINKFRDHPDFRLAPLQTLHQLSFGTGPNIMWRRGELVEGYPEQVPTDVSSASASFIELENATRFIATTPVKNVEVAAHLLAYIFSAVIRIHPFEDGNGRVARFSVQYLMKSWGMNLLPLPKVRNDTEWQNALKAAIEGNPSLLADQFLVRLT